jgi:hypothetical protein
MKHTKSMIYSPSTEARELTLYAVNTGSLYTRAIVPAVRNLARKYRKGTFDAVRAIDAFFPIATEAARMYCREFARLEDAPQIFDVTARFTAAADMLDYYMENVEKGDL